MPGEQHDPTSGPHDPTSAPLRLRTPTDLLAALPYLVHQPLDDAVVALVLREESVLGVLYGGLDHLDHVLTPDRSGRAAVDAALGEGGGALLVAGFGHSARITPHVRALLREARARGLLVLEALRVTGDRYWSYLCRDPDCCPAEGRRFDPNASPVPAGAVVRGLVPVGRDPSARVGFLLEPVQESVRSEVAEAAASEEARLSGADQVERHTAAVLETLREEARHRVTAPEALARLGVHLTRVPVRDAVWTRITPDTAAVHVRLWSRVVRHVPERHRAAPAALLAVAAWQHDDLDLARAAVDAALEAEPGYAMAVLMARALETGLPAERWRGFLASRTQDGDAAEEPERSGAEHLGRRSRVVSGSHEVAGRGARGPGSGPSCRRGSSRVEHVGRCSRVVSGSHEVAGRGVRGPGSDPSCRKGRTRRSSQVPSVRSPPEVVTTRLTRAVHEGARFVLLRVRGGQLR